MIGPRVPEGPGQADSREDFHHFIGRGTTRIDGQSVCIPSGGQTPKLSQRKYRPLGHAMACTPSPDVFFRPEEKHRLSGMNNIVKPMSGGDGEMHCASLRQRRAIADEERHGLAAVRARTEDVRVVMESDRDA